MELGFAPKFIILYGAGSLVSATPVNAMDMIYGFWAAGVGAGQALRSRYLSRADGVNAAPVWGSRSGTFQADDTSGCSIAGDSTGFTATWLGPTPVNWTVGYLAVGGSDVRAYIAPQPLQLTTQQNGITVGAQVTHDVGLPWVPTCAMQISNQTLAAFPNVKGIGMGWCDMALGQYSIRNWSADAGGAGRDAFGNTFVNADTLFQIKIKKYIKGGAVFEPTVTSGTPGVSDRTLHMDVLYIDGPLSGLQVFGHRSGPGLQNRPVGFKPQAALLFAQGEWPVLDGNATQKMNIGSYSNHGGVDQGSSVGWVDSGTSGAPGPYTYHKGMHRSDISLFTTESATNDAAITSYTSWIVPSGIDAKPDSSWDLNWLGASTRAFNVGMLSFASAYRLEGVIDLTSDFEVPPELKGNRPLNGIIDSVMTFDTTQLGARGNLDALPMDLTFSLETPGLGFARPLDGVIDITSELASPGIGFERPLDGVIEAAFTFEGAKIGRLWENTGVIDAVFTMDGTGIGFDRPLSGVIPMESDLNAYFVLPMPTVRPSGKDDLVGTVNLVVNPSVEAGLTGWYGVGIEPVWTQESVWDGTRSAKYVTVGADQGYRIESATGLEMDGWARDPQTGVEMEGIPRTLVSQVRLRVPAGDTVFTLKTRAVYQDLTTTESDPLDVTVTGEWRAYYPPAIQLDQSKKVIRIETEGVTASGVTFYADGAQIEEDRGQGPTPWVTGAYGKDSGEWLNPRTPNLSVSVRQPFPAIIKGIGRGGAATIKGTMYRVDQDNNILDDVSDLVIEARATMDVRRRSTWQLDCSMSSKAWEYMRPNEDWLAPFLRIEYPNGEVKEGQLGHYFVTPSAMQRGEFGGKVRVSAFDSLWLLDRQEFVGSQYFPALTDHAEAIRQMIAGGIMPDGSSFRRFFIPDSGILMAQAFEWEDGTSRLAGSLELCEGGALYPLWTDPTGFITTKRMGAWRLRDQTPVKGYTAHIPDNVVVDPWIPRVAALKSEVVGEIAISPKAMDYVDRVLVTSADPRLATPIESRAMLVYADAPIDGLVDALDDPTNPVVYQEWYRQNQARGRDGRRRQGNRQGRRRMKSLPYAGVGRTMALPSRLVTSAVAAKELAATLVDNLSSQVEHASFSVFPDPSIDYAHATVVCNIWDAYEDAVAVGQYVVRRAQFGFTPKTAMQVLDLDWVDPNESEIVLT